ncbi:hypothetical protein FOA52_009149 [Chlamydomonas sp. UWO 241]|nr:hypothetical protein FOA52_009149 [Chlamydomonas sp. UWO 241]
MGGAKLIRSIAAGVLCFVADAQAVQAGEEGGGKGLLGAVVRGTGIAKKQVVASKAVVRKGLQSLAAILPFGGSITDADDGALLAVRLLTRMIRSTFLCMHCAPLLAFRF